MCALPDDGFVVMYFTLSTREVWWSYKVKSAFLRFEKCTLS